MESENDMITALARYSQRPPNLPDEIITEILLRLPVKCLMKFKCVSKSWRCLISSNHFAKAHLKISTNNNVYAHSRLVYGSKAFPMDLYTCSLDFAVDNFTTGFVYPTADENLVVDCGYIEYPIYQPSEDWPEHEFDDVIWLVGSCNGLVCVRLFVKTLIFWNPSTRESRVLSESGMNCNSYSITYGFGYDELHNDYKVVEFLRYYGGRGVIETHVKVYSLRSDSWKTLDNWPGGNTYGGTGKFLSGSIHWMVSDFPSMGEWEIVAHDLATDTFSELPMPKLEEFHCDITVSILNGCLSICCEYHTYVDLWIMKEYGVGESWTRVCRIPSSLYLEEPLYLMADGKVLINYGTNLRIYDSRTPDVHQFGGSTGVEATTYVESLVSPNLHDGSNIENETDMITALAKYSHPLPNLPEETSQRFYGGCRRNHF